MLAYLLAVQQVQVSTIIVFDCFGLLGYGSVQLLAKTHPREATSSGVLIERLRASAARSFRAFAASVLSQAACAASVASACRLLPSIPLHPRVFGKIFLTAITSPAQIDDPCSPPKCDRTLLHNVWLICRKTLKSYKKSSIRPTDLVGRFWGIWPVSDRALHG